MQDGSFAAAVVAKRRVVLAASWRDQGVLTTSSCQVVLTFIPEEGQKYVYTFVGPGRTGRCSAGLTQVVDDDIDQQVKVPSLRFPRRSPYIAGPSYPELSQLPLTESPASTTPPSPANTRPHGDEVDR